MKAKISRGSGFRGALDYIFDTGAGATNTKKAERVGGNLSGLDPRALSREFAAVRELRPDVARPVWHCSLSLPPGDRLASEKWEGVARDFLSEMGFPESTPWVAVRHQDTDKDHIHIVASRVALDASVWLGQWEARRAIDATQALEQRHGLTLTPGLGDVRKEEKALTAGEINMAVRTGAEPPRQKLQRLVDAAMTGNPSAPEFADRLAAAGVSVRANIASTGRMNGFSFEVDGIPFKGSDLGKSYTWGGLQKRGLTYDENADRAGLERFRPAASDRGVSDDVAADREPDAVRSSDLAASSSSRDSASAGAADPVAAGRDADTRGLRPSGTGAAPEPRQSGIEPDGQGSAAVRPESAEPRPVTSESGHTGPESGLVSGGDRAHLGASAQTPRRPDERSRGDAAGRGEPASLDPAALESPVSAADRGAPVRGDSWNSRFKIDSAARRRGSVPGDVAKSHATGARANAADRQSARTLDPTAYLEACGYTVKKEGRHLSVRVSGDEVYRVTRQAEGHYLWCDRYENSGGDNIDLVREIEPGTGYAEAVYRLAGAPTVRQKPPPPAEPLRKPPKLPAMDGELDGRAYLQGRGISAAAIERGEKAGMVRYAAGSVFFVGYDPAGVAQNVTRRAVRSTDAVQKRDLSGSSKAFPPILPGVPGRVWIVEGGTDALALHDIAERSGQPLPTVIVSGGANVCSFLETPEIQTILKRAERVTVAGENEKAPDVQARADAGHDRQAARVREIVGESCQVQQWTPRSEHGKDLADFNQRQREAAEQRRQEELAAAAAAEREAAAAAAAEAEAARRLARRERQRDRGYDGPGW